MTKKLMRIVQNCWMKEGESHLQECLGLAKAIRENNIPSTLVRLVVKIFREQRRNPTETFLPEHESELGISRPL